MSGRKNRPVSMIPGAGWHLVYAAADGTPFTEQVLAFVLSVDEEGFISLDPYAAAEDGIDLCDSNNRLGLLAPGDTLTSFDEEARAYVADRARRVTEP